MADLLADSVALSWEQLEALAPAPAERCEGPANAQATLRLFGQPGVSGAGHVVS